jgi:two-component system, chemotaxis family, sensor kinase CheA
LSLQPTIDEIAKSCVLTDENDLPMLVSIHDRLRSLGGDLPPDMERVAECLEHAASLIKEIIYREAQDAAATLDLVRQGVEYAQRAAAADQEGRSINDLGPTPYETAGGSNVPSAKEDTIDPEMLAAWVTECGMNLGELEGNLVGDNSATHSPETLGDIRRRLHTFKGECGVLSLHTAQKLCHEAESSIDHCIATGQALPVDALLSLVDWLRTYVNSLSKDPRAKAPEHAAVLALFTNRSTPSAAPAAAPALVSAPAAAATAAPAAAPAAAPTGSPAASATVEDPAFADPTPVSLHADGDMKDNLNDFLCESREHIANSEVALLELEKKPTDKELINTVFRAFHTIKGVAGFMNLGPIVSLAHSAEYLLDGARNDKVLLNSQSLSIILKTCDLMGQMIRVFEGGAPPSTGQHKALINQLERAVKGDLSTTSAPAPAPAPAVSAPSASPASAPVITAAPVTAAPSDSPSVEAKPTANTNALATPNVEAKPAPAATPSASNNAKRADQTVKVSTSRMDTLVDMVGELVIAQQMVVQDPAVRTINEQRLQRNLSMVGKIIRDLQEVSMSLRMVPVKSTFQKMARLVRDVSAKAGKNITLHTEGEDVELDRNVVEEIADPLVHMIRNSCDHGVETADVRRASGKPDAGNVWLRAFHSGGSIVIEIEDDGKGLDRTKIVKKAIEKGIYTPDRAIDDIPDSEVFALIFLPGFSTADKVTDISGRGVGMDVVRRNIEALRGKIEIRSTFGKGTIFSMRLPLTMAIIDGMVVRVGNQRYVIPTLSIERSFRPQPKDLHTVVGSGEMAMVRGGLLPIYRLNHVLGHDLDSKCDLLIVVESQAARACLAADEIIGQQQVVIKSLGQATQAIRGVSGGAILGDGRVALILDIGGILNEATASVPA